MLVLPKQTPKLAMLVLALARQATLAWRELAQQPEQEAERSESALLAQVEVSVLESELAKESALVAIQVQLERESARVATLVQLEQG